MCEEKGCLGMGQNRMHVEKIETSAGVCVLKRSRRRTLAISVLPDGTLEVTAPADALCDEICARVEKRVRWIMRQRRAFAMLSAQQPSRRYCTGATHRYLGKQYRLKVIIGAEQGAKLRGSYLHVVSRTGTEKSVALLVGAWLRKRAYEQFLQRLVKWRDLCKKENLPEPRLRLLVMAKRWGSLQKGGWMTLTPELVRAPSVCIDYVIAHEMCHIKYRHHDKRFFSMLGKVCPGWKTHKMRLESVEL